MTYASMDSADIRPSAGRQLGWCLQAFVAALAAGAAAAAALSAGVFWLIEPSCTSGEWLCGIGELFVAMAIGGCVGLVVFGWVAYRLVAAWVPAELKVGLAIGTILGGPVVLACAFAAFGLAL